MEQRKLDKAVKINRQDGCRPMSFDAVLSGDEPLYVIPSELHNPAMAKLHNFKFVDGAYWKGGKYWNQNWHGRGVNKGRLMEDRKGKPIEYVKPARVNEQAE
eukprot:CAMPEP_0173409150 /NCGR_PEP_ID=MMETSP1356-20130122/71504_1 /TAXON_ID=77927 ORGANISM="Hemiselmis virescens, Strain PCC157" /NCGR_SAMPLE_ID=MMETSP1356 /ASSEMBLY_ACC=CAM_ASM_000847 /LENGTH=101 /DNA_ID=CAMNT_0014370573 /DNA_START=150 /DNA_END=455 /DNA_ORIENTATION=-